MLGIIVKSVVFVVIAVFIISLCIIIIKLLLSCLKKRQQANAPGQNHTEVQRDCGRNGGLSETERNVIVHVPNSTTKHGQQNQIRVNVPKSKKTTSVYVILEDDKSVPTTVRRESIPGTSNTTNTQNNTFSTGLLKNEYFKQPPCNPSFENNSSIFPTAPPNTNIPKKILDAKPISQKYVQFKTGPNSQNTNDSTYPKLIIHHIPSFRLTDERTFLTNFIIHNKLQDCAYISIVHKKARGHLFDIVIKVDPITRAILLKTGQVYVEKMRYKIEDSFHIIQCYKCARFGHISKNCKSDKPYCLICAENHHTQICTSTRHCCINCKRYNSNFAMDYDTRHLAKSKECPLYEEQIDRIKSKTNYTNCQRKNK